MSGPRGLPSIPGLVGIQPPVIQAPITIQPPVTRGVPISIGVPIQTAVPVTVAPPAQIVIQPTFNIAPTPSLTPPVSVAPPAISFQPNPLLPSPLLSNPLLSSPQVIAASPLEDETQLDELLEEYPSVTTPGYQTLFSAKPEFRFLASSSVERLQSGRGQKFKHQELIQRALRTLDDLFIIDQTGTGKSCTVIGFTEYAYDQFLLGRTNSTVVDEHVGHFKRTIVLVHGPVQKAEFENQLVCRCTTGTRYETSTVKRANNESSQKRELTQQITKWYTIYTYFTFYKHIMKNYPSIDDNARLARDYADTIFWVDEAHNVLVDTTISDVDPTKRVKRATRRAGANVPGVNLQPSLINPFLPTTQLAVPINLTSTPTTAPIIGPAPLLQSRTQINDTPIPGLIDVGLNEAGLYQDSTVLKPTEVHQKILIYHTFWRVFHLAPRCKRIISTATPMINGEEDIGSLWNLILPANGDLPVGWNPTQATDNDFRVLFPDMPRSGEPGAPTSREEMAAYYEPQFPPDYDYTKAELHDIEPRIRGRISFVRSLETGAQIENKGIRDTEVYILGSKQYQSQVTVWNTTMSKFQTDVYAPLLLGTQGRNDIFSAERQAANFVFPDGTWGGTGASNQIKSGRRKKKGQIVAVTAPAPVPAATPIIQAPIISGLIQRPLIQAPIIQLPSLTGLITAPATINPVGLAQLPSLTATEDIFAAQVNQSIEADFGAFPAPSTIADRSGTTGFRRYVIMEPEARFRATDDFKAYLGSLEKIGQLSCKYAAVCDLTMRKPGNCFVYGEYVQGSGLIVLGLCLESLGCIRFDERYSVFEPMGSISKIRAVCSGTDNATLRRIRPDIRLTANTASDPPRYALLTGGVAGTPRFRVMMEAMNSRENMHGGIIKIFLSSRTGRDGININNVLQIHILGGEWNESVTYQALSRGIRATSHEDLLEEKRAQMVREGLNPDLATVKVKIYRHSAQPQQEGSTYGKSGIDLRQYRKSEEKARRIARLMRIHKQISITCQIHYGRNVRPARYENGVKVGGDVDGTPDCDYDVCRYICVDPAPTAIDYSTYDVLYADEVIADAILSIQDVFRQRNAASFEELARGLFNYRRKFLVAALERLIVGKQSFTDRFGYTSYLREDNGMLYLDRTYPTTAPSYSMAYYTQGLIAVQRTSLPDIVIDLSKRESRNTFIELQEIMDGLPSYKAFKLAVEDKQRVELFAASVKDLRADPTYVATMSTLTIESAASLLEEAIFHIIVLHSPTALTAALTLQFDSSIFILPEPVAALDEAHFAANSIRSKRGPKPKPGNKRRTRRLTDEELRDLAKAAEVNTGAETVYIHTLYGQVRDQTSYSTVARSNNAEGRKRILKVSEVANGGSWRDMDNIESGVYQPRLKGIIAGKLRELGARYGVYGLLETQGPDKGKFRIADVANESPDAVHDNRKKNRSRVCNTWDKDKLLDVMWRIGVSRPAGPLAESYTEATRAQAVNHLTEVYAKRNQPLSQPAINAIFGDLTTWPIERIIYYIKYNSLNNSELPKAHMCTLIQLQMENLGILGEIA